MTKTKKYGGNLRLITKFEERTTKNVNRVKRAPKEGKKEKSKTKAEGSKRVDRFLALAREESF